MSDTEQILDPHLVQLVLSMQAGAMQQMGKIASPMTGKIERDIEMAKFSIDILGMLETKTKGNLSEDEQRFLGHVLYELRLNFVDESKKSDEKADVTDKAPDAEDTGSQAAEQDKANTEAAESDKPETKATESDQPKTKGDEQ